MPLSFDFGLWSSFFLSVFLFATLSITIRPFDWYLHNTIHKKKKKNIYKKITNRPINQNRQSPSTKRPTRRELTNCKIKGSRRGRSSKFSWKQFYVRLVSCSGSYFGNVHFSRFFLSLFYSFSIYLLSFFSIYLSHFHFFYFLLC